MRTLSLTFVTVSLLGALAYAQAPAAPAAAAPGAPATGAPAAATPAPGAPAATPAPQKPEPQGYAYNPEGRRDPFVSLLKRGSDARANAGPKLSGLAGLGTSEVSLRGTLASRGAFVGILQGADSKTYIVRTGDRLSDGTIRSITADSMVILQQVNDPLSLEKQREVRKLLRQTEEAK
jgi:Tfp pilus assembly protein PilP